MTDALDLDRYFPYQLSRLAHTVSRGTAQCVAQQCGLALREARLVVVLGALGESSAAQLVARTAMDKAPVSRALANLVRLGLVQRLPDPLDGRAYLLNLTAEGRALHGELRERLLERERRLLAALSDTEQTQLLRLMQRLTSHIESTEDVGFAWTEE